MEYALWLEAGRRLGKDVKIVLILVLMEYALWLADIARNAGVTMVS